MRTIKSYRSIFETFQKIQEALEISEADLKKPMIQSEELTDLNLIYPYSKVTCLILYLYSMELGSPQLYAEANRVARTMDTNYLKELGPFLRALAVITLRVEHFKKPGDIIKTGQMLVDWNKNNMCGSFLLFRGAEMMRKWMEPYLAKVGQPQIHLPGN